MDVPGRHRRHADRQRHRQADALPTVAYFAGSISPFNATNATGTTQNNAELQQGAYAKVNVSAAFQTGRFTFKAFANNLFDRQTYAYGLDLRGAGFLQLPRAFHAAHVRRSVRVAF
jgi:hypothetical protein